MDGNSLLENEFISSIPSEVISTTTKYIIRRGKILNDWFYVPGKIEKCLCSAYNRYWSLKILLISDQYIYKDP